MTPPKLPKRAEAGAVIGGYELVRRIGRGGMAEVWVARKALGRKGTKFVAIKLIADHYVGDERYARMFRAEAELAAVLSHANIVQVFDEGEEDARSFLIMEWVDGLNLLKLGAVLSLLDDEERRFRVISYIIGQLLHALNYAHSITSFDGSPLGVVHRDVSPQNVLVSNHGEVKLTDFGVAFHNFEESSGIHVKGKVRYMSPEQLAGKTRLPTVDLYAVGALLHELLDGKKFRGELEDGQELFTTVLSGKVAPLSRPAPPGLDRLRLALLEPDPTLRVQTAEDAVAILKRFPGYGDARDELTKLCGSLTGVVKPRVGPGQSSQVEAADKRTTQWGGRRQPLAAPKVNTPSRPAAPSFPGRSSSAPIRTTGSVTAVKGHAVAQASAALITGQTEFVRPQSLSALVGGAAAQAEAPKIVSPSAPTLAVRTADVWNPGQAPAPANGVQAPAQRIQAQAPTTPLRPPMPGDASSSPVPTYVAGQPSHPIQVQPSAPIDVSWPGPTERLHSSETSGVASHSQATEVLDPAMVVEVGMGSGTEQEMLPPLVQGDGTDTSRMPMHSNTVSIVLPKRSAVAAIGVGLVLVAIMSVSVTWLLFKQGGEAEAATGSEVAAGMVGATEEPEAEESAKPVPATKAEDPQVEAPEVEDPRLEEVQQAKEGDDAKLQLDGGGMPGDAGEAADERSTDDPADEPKAPEAASEDEEVEGNGNQPTTKDPRPVVKKDTRPSKPLPKVSVNIGGSGMFDKAQVKVGNKAGGMGAELQVPVGRRTVLWRKSSSDSWQSGGRYTFKEGHEVTIFVTPGGLKFHAIG